MTNLNIGTGAPCAGHLSLSFPFSGWVILERSVSEGNLGAEPPTGSKIVKYDQPMYLNAGLGEPCAGHVKTASVPSTFVTLERSD